MYVCMYFHFLFCSICGCEAGMTIWKIEGWGVSIGCGQVLGGVIKYEEVWSRYCGLISNTVAGLIDL